MTNEEKARELCMAIEPPYIDFIQQNYKTALQAMQWKDKQWAERFKKAFEGLWTASLNVDDYSSKAETTIEFKLVTRK